jgi:hypothetical protein
MYFLIAKKRWNALSCRAEMDKLGCRRSILKRLIATGGF